MLERRIPTAEPLLGQGRRPEELDIAGRQLEPRLIGGERLPVVHRHVPIVLAQGKLSLGPIGPERLGPLRRLSGLRCQLGRGRALGIEGRTGAGELSPGGYEGRVEGHRLLVERHRAPETRRISYPHGLRGRLTFEEGVVGRQVRGRLGRQLVAGAVA